jgi:hypothetical protein
VEQVVGMRGAVRDLEPSIYPTPGHTNTPGNNQQRPGLLRAHPWPARFASHQGSIEAHIRLNPHHSVLCWCRQISVNLVVDASTDITLAPRILYSHSTSAISQYFLQTDVIPAYLCLSSSRLLYCICLNSEGRDHEPCWEYVDPLQGAQDCQTLK